MIKLVFILVFSLLCSCTGYRFRPLSNPFEQYGIKTVAIPMFLNKSPVPDTAGVFTDEITLLLSRYPGLKIKGANYENADAVLIGVIDSDRDKYTETVKTSGQKTTNSIAPKSLNGRSDFYVPFANALNLKLNLILIKNPSFKEIDLSRTDLGPLLKGNPKIIFNEVVSVNGSFNRDMYDADGGKVNFTQNKGALNRTIKTMANNAANTFKDTVLYAF